MTEPTTPRRQRLIRQMIGPAVPRLWCPPITHYTPEGAVDTHRMTAHWRTMVPYVGGFLVPGSTGDGWEMSEAEIADMLTLATDLAVSLDTQVLIGALRPSVNEMLDVIKATLASLKAVSGTEDALAALQARHVAAFTICPPQGADLSQSAIQSGLEAVLDLGLPTAIYQLPQVTQNEIAPEVFKDLAARYGNFVFLKDTSGEDRVPLADRGHSGVFLVRGAEGNYASWLREAGGCYDGLLLSSANGFAAELAEMIALLETGELDLAFTLSERITAAVRGAFAAVADVAAGNAFANANKALDHVRAYGRDALDAAPPLLHAGIRLPQSVVAKTCEILAACGFMPVTGYL